MDDQTVKFWTAVSHFETDDTKVGEGGWDSRVFRDSNNLFNIIEQRNSIYPHLSYGEGQTIYPSLEKAAQALIDRVVKPFRYPLQFRSIDDLVTFMKSKGYFEAPLDQYKAGARRAYRILYPNEVIV